MPPTLFVVALTVASSSGPLTVGERTPALVVVALPRGAAPSTPATELTRAADIAFRARTGLDVRAPEQAGVDAERIARCDGAERLACWVETARAGRERLAAILAITVLPIGDGRDRIALTLIDTERAARCGAEGGGTREAREAVEDCIFVGAARTEPEVVALDELSSFFSGHIEQALAPLLEAMGELAPFGRLEIDAETPDVELWIDRALRGKLSAGRTTVEELRAGRRRLAFRRPGYAPLVRAIHIERSVTATAAVTLVPLGASPDTRRVVFYSGVAAATIGASLGVYAIVRAGAVDSGCLQRDEGATCAALGAPRFGVDGSATPTTDRDLVSSGVPIPMVAAGVGFAGVGWALSTWLLEGDGGVPWVEIAIGVGAGLVAATTAVLVDPR